MYCADQNDSESSTYYCYIIDIFWSFAIQIKLYVFIAATIKLFVFYLHIYIYMLWHTLPSMIVGGGENYQIFNFTLISIY